MTSVCIWAPHPDDEIIGCWSVLNRKHDVQDLTVIYFSDPYDPGILRCSDMYGFQCHTILIEDASRFLGPISDLLQPYSIVLAPDPATDWHPLHQYIGQTAQQMFRNRKIFRLGLYTTRMTAPYVHKVQDPEAKRAALGECYPQKTSLWESDHRFFLFEGLVEWHRPGEI